MYILLKAGDIIREGDEMQESIVIKKSEVYGHKVDLWWTAIDPRFIGSLADKKALYRRNLTGWEAVKYALETEVLGNDKEGCETIPWMWECDCKDEFLHVCSEFGRCSKCGASDVHSPDARKADVILKIMEEQ